MLKDKDNSSIKKELKTFNKTLLKINEFLHQINTITSHFSSSKHSIGFNFSVKSHSGN